MMRHLSCWFGHTKKKREGKEEITFSIFAGERMAMPRGILFIPDPVDPRPVAHFAIHLMGNSPLNSTPETKRVCATDWVSAAVHNGVKRV
jgi:hypothetical protein